MDSFPICMLYRSRVMKWFLVSLYAISVCHIHFRGRVRLPVLRQVFDHSSFMAPINMFLHWFSGVPQQPYLSLHSFPELAPLQENWEVIRDEALHVQRMAKIKAAERNDDAGFNSFFKTGWKRFYLKWYARAILRRSSGVRKPSRCCAGFRA